MFTCICMYIYIFCMYAYIATEFSLFVAHLVVSLTAGYIE